jgi:hypothetical protein
MKYLFLFFLIVGCSNTVTKQHYEVAKSIMSSFSKSVKQQYGLYISASGGSMMYDIKKICFDFNAVKQLDVSLVRVLYLNIVDQLIERLNDTAVRPFLHNYPANTSNVEIKIAFYMPNGQRVNENFVAFVYMIDNIIYYRKWKDNDFQRLHQETYEEAVKIVRGGGFPGVIPSQNPCHSEERPNLQNLIPKSD